MGNLIKDLKYGIRMLLAHPGFSAVAVLSLALGIGLNTTIFSIVNSVLLRPAPVEKPDQLVEIYSRNPNALDHSTISYPDYLDFREQADSFSGLLGYTLMMASLSQEGRSELIIGEIVTGNYFDVLGVDALLGRTFLPEEDQTPGSHPVVVLGHQFWQRQFAGDPAALGETVKLNGTRYTVVGVLPPSFTGAFPGFSPELWVPTMMVGEVDPMGIQDVQGEPPGDNRLDQRGRRWMFVKGRLEPGVTLDQARAEMVTIARRLENEYPDSNEKRGVTLLPAEDVRFHPMLDKPLTPVAILLLSVVGIVLLIACANVANMLLARATTRRREIAVRLAVGASRARLVRQLLAESLVLSGLGGGLGLLLAIWANGLLQNYRLEFALPLAFHLGVDIRVLAFTIGLSLLTGLVFGLAPALQASRADLISALKESSLDQKAVGRFHLGNLLVVGQVALSLVLLIGAGLLVRSLIASRAAEIGFSPDGLGVVTLNLGMNGYEEEQGKAFYRQTLERIRSLPGVESATITSRYPFDMNINMTDIYVDGHELTQDEDKPFLVDVTHVGNDYFRTMGISLLEGRPFRESDTEGSPEVVIANEKLARTFWPQESAVGKRIRRKGPDGPTYEIVGVAQNHKVRTVGEDDRPYLHFPRAQNYNAYGNLVFRTSLAGGDAAATVETVRRELLAVNPELVIMNATSLNDQLAATLYPVRMGSNLLGGFSLLAVLLAAIGLYGLIAYWVSQRTHEVGIRMALGAESTGVMVLVLKRGMILASIGVIIGLAGALFVNQTLAGVLFGVPAADPLTLAISSLILLGAALVANAVPAWRASRVDPMVALRYE
jgi:predicted permease